MEKGVVVKSTGSWYMVRLENGIWVECRIRGKFRIEGIRTTNPVAVGDVVGVEENNDGWVITVIEPRKIILFVKQPIFPKNLILSLLT